MKTVKLILLIALPVVLLSCNDRSGNRNRDNNYRNKKENKTTKPSNADTVSKGSLLPFIQLGMQDKDEDFLKEAAIGGLFEVEMGQYAEKNATNPRVKEFGAMMVKDHKKVNEELKSVGKNFNLPTELDNNHQRKISELKEKSGVEFDKAYMKEMVDDHEKDVDKFEKVADNGKEPQVKSFAEKTLPVLQMHLDSAKNIRDAIK